MPGQTMGLAQAYMADPGSQSSLKGLREIIVPGTTSVFTSQGFALVGTYLL